MSLLFWFACSESALVTQNTETGNRFQMNDPDWILSQWIKWYIKTNSLLRLFNGFNSTVRVYYEYALLLLLNVNRYINEQLTSGNYSILYQQTGSNEKAFATEGTAVLCLRIIGIITLLAAAMWLILNWATRKETNNNAKKFILSIHLICCNGAVVHVSVIALYSAFEHIWDQSAHAVGFSSEVLFIVEHGWRSLLFCLVTYNHHDKIK